MRWISLAPPVRPFAPPLLLPDRARPRVAILKRSSPRCQDLQNGGRGLLEGILEGRPCLRETSRRPRGLRRVSWTGWERLYGTVAIAGTSMCFRQVLSGQGESAGSRRRACRD